MRRLRLASGLILLLLLMACGRTAPSPGPVAPPPVPPETADSMAVLPGPGGSAGGQAGPGPGAPAPGSDLKALITPAPAGAFQRLRIAAGKPIDRTGIFFLQTASGEVEGWAVAGDEMDRFWYGTSDDGRWVSAQGSPEYSYVADRKTGAVYRWPWQAALVQGARGEHLLFSVSGRLWLATADMAHFTALGIGAQQPQAFFSPDGTAVAIRADRKLYLVQVGSGEVLLANLRDATGCQPLAVGVGYRLSQRYRYREPFTGCRGDADRDVVVPGRRHLDLAGADAAQRDRHPPGGVGARRLVKLPAGQVTRQPDRNQGIGHGLAAGVYHRHRQAVVGLGHALELQHARPVGPDRQLRVAGDGVGHQSHPLPVIRIIQVDQVGRVAPMTVIAPPSGFRTRLAAREPGV